jgi:hypothetical protein
LIYLPPDQLGDLIEDYKKDAVKLKEQITEICYFMKGGAEWNSAWGMSYEDREIAIKVINKRLKEANPNAKDYF